MGGIFLLFLNIVSVHVVLKPNGNNCCSYIEEVLLFFKYYNPTTKVISYVGHSVESIERKFSE